MLTIGASDLARTDTLAFLKGTSGTFCSPFPSSNLGLLGDPQLWEVWSRPSSVEACFPGFIWDIASGVVVGHAEISCALSSDTELSLTSNAADGRGTTNCLADIMGSEMPLFSSPFCIHHWKWILLITELIHRYIVQIPLRFDMKNAVLRN